MKQPMFLTVVAALVLLSVMISVTARQAQPGGSTKKDFVAPIVFQAAGPTITSIQGSVDAFRAALGANNGIAAPPQPLTEGRREINWDGGNPANTATTLTPTPILDTFLIGRGARFTTPGSGFVQAPASGLAAADVFGNPSYATIFKTFSPSRLFSPIGSNVTDTLFFVPGGGEVRATTRGFGAVFTDVDQPGASKKGKHGASSQIDYFDADGELLFTSFIPASPGDGSLSFFGIVFEDARIARVRITSGNVAPGPDDDAKLDIVMMDDFLYGEPQHLL